MKRKTDPQAGNLKQLRAKASARLAAAPPSGVPARAPETLLHELQVNQIELEMLNEELRRANSELEESRDRYLELYEFAPVGYLSLTRAGTISEVSLNGAVLLGDERQYLLRSSFAGFIATQDRVRWRRHFAHAMQTGSKQSCELTLRRRDGSEFQARLNCQRLEREPDTPGMRVALTDMTDVAELRRAVAETRIAAIVFEAQEGMLITDGGGTILRVNRAFTEISGYTEQEALGRTARMLKSGRHDAAFFAAMWAHINHAGSWQGEIWNRRKNGEVFPAFVTITAVQQNGEGVTHYVGTMLDITQRKEAEEEIQNLAFYDPLTKLPNRRLLLDRLRQALAASGRNRRDGALLFIDLDDFKTLNDTLGHDIGDLLLVQVAERLSSCIREGDTVARLGGDEFVVILENLRGNADESATQVERIGEKMIMAMNQPFLVGDYERHTTASIGVTLFGDHERTVEELMKRADFAMYQAKAAGCNTLRFFDPEMQAVVTARATLENALRAALFKKEFVLYFQPQVNEARHLIGFEALVRWQNPLRGLVAPHEFIPSAEETGLILPLGLWVLETACAQLVTWAESAKTAGLSLAVNVSARQFHQSNFMEQVLAVLDRSGANPLRLKLELTESVMLEDVEATIAKMSALKDRGVRFSLDDFGVGYSSLSYLKRLPLDQLKIDRTFVHNLMKDPNDSAIAKMVVALAKSMNLEVIAEGVETEEQRDFLAHHGCRDYQGYLFSPPLPQAACEKFLH